MTLAVIMISTSLFTMLLPGLLIAHLMTQQRQQRTALATAAEEQARTNEKLVHYATSLEELTISRERNRLARELHDTLAHSLSAAAVQIEAVHSLWSVNEAQARAMLTSVDDTVRTGLKEARRSLQALRASPLEEVGLVYALRDAAEGAAKRGDLTLHLEIPEAVAHLPAYVEQAIYRIGQEALENVVRHARARNVWLCIQHSVQHIELHIQDDGIGFEPDTLLNEEYQLGIQGMQERAAMLDGTLTIESQPEQGTTVRLEVALTSNS